MSKLNVTSVRDVDTKMKFENMLEKKCKELETLGDSLVFKEKEILLNYKEKLELSKIDKNPAMLEKRALLQDTDEEDSEDAEFAKGKWKSIIKLTSSIPIQDIEKRGVTRRNQHTSRGAAQNEESKDHILNLEESQQMETI